MAVLYIDDSELKAQVVKLREMHKSVLPVTIRQVLNKAAFDVKRTTMPATSMAFIHRRKTFFTANSAAISAVGFNVNTMVAAVGFNPKANDKSHSVEDLEQQERGGEIANRSFVALAKARVGGSWEGNVKAKNRLQNMNLGSSGMIIDSAKSKGKSGAQQFVRAAFEAVRKYGPGNAFVLNQDHSRLIRIKSATGGGYAAEGGFAGNGKVKSEVIDSVQKNRKAKVHATHFMRDASVVSGAKMNEWFIELSTAKIEAMK